MPAGPSLDEAPPSTAMRWTLGAIVAASGAVRLAAARDELWLDEIMSIQMARGISSAADVFVELLVDNNHPLTTLWLHVLGSESSALAYRAPSVIAGTLAVLLGALFVGRGHRGRARGIAWCCTAAVLGSSYLLIHYSSEARGYGPALAFSIAAAYCAQRGLEEDRTVWALAYGAAILLALLSHPTALFALAGILAWTSVRWLRTLPGSSAATRALRWHALPLGFLALYWAFFLSRLEVFGGPPTTAAEALLEVAAFASGAPLAASLWATGLSIVLFLAGTLLLLREGDDRWVLYWAAVVLAPMLAIGIDDPVFFFPRYFLLSATFGLLLVSDLLARQFANGGGSRLVAGMLLAAAVAGGASWTLDLLRTGRGSYEEALTLMASRTTDDVVTVGSDNDFRNTIVMRFYLPRLDLEKPFRYFAAGQWQADAPEWLLLHGFEGRDPPYERLVTPDGIAFRRVATFPSVRLSGWTWHVLRRTSRIEAAASVERPSS